MEKLKREMTSQGIDPEKVLQAPDEIIRKKYIILKQNQEQIKQIPQLILPPQRQIVTIEVAKKPPPMDTKGTQFPDERYLKEQETLRLISKKEYSSKMA